VTRLVPQKGPLLLAHAFRYVLEQGAQCVILGSVFSEEMRELFSFLQAEYRASKQGIILLESNEALAHKIYAAADLFLVPSIFEPCGLSQMIALRYGTIPIIRKTGGLGDTVFEGQNGFVFENPTKEALCTTLDRALTLYKEHPSLWQKLMKAGMTQDHSWRHAAQHYLKLYTS